MNTNEDGYTFADWYAKANRECIAIAGVGIDDLPDGNSNDAWASNATPLDYVIMMLEEEGFPFDDLDNLTRKRIGLPPVPQPRRLYGGHDVEHIRTEGGKVLVVERNRAANGKHGRVYLVTPEEIDREQYR